MHALASELERVKTELNDRTAMMGIEMERWRQQADATSTQVLLHHVRGVFCWAGAHAVLAVCYLWYSFVELQCHCTAMVGTYVKHWQRQADTTSRPVLLLLLAKLC